MKNMNTCQIEKKKYNQGDEILINEFDVEV